MEANKASNMMAHREEIMSRPARSWFQTSKERMAVQEESKRSQPTSAKAAAAAEGGWGDDDAGKGGKKGKKGERDGGGGNGGEKKVKRDKFAGMTRMKRRRIQRDEQLAKDDSVTLPNQKAIARGAKAASKKGRMGYQGGSLTSSLQDAVAEPPPKRARTDEGGDGGGGGGARAEKKPKEPKKGPGKQAPRVKPTAIKKKHAHSKPKFAKRTKGR